MKQAEFPLLDSLRALSAIAILVVHVAIFSDAIDDPIYGRLVSHLDIGVPFFFLLSAFLLYRPFVAARAAGAPRRSFRVYGVRRFWRIAPAYWAALTISAIVPGMAGAFTGNWWVYYGLLQNLPVYTVHGVCATDVYRCALPTTWTLAIEIAFYALLPLFVLLTAWLTSRSPRIHWLRIELALVAALFIVSVYIQGMRIDSDFKQWLFFSPLGRGWWFALGLAMAAIWVSADRGESRHRVIEWMSRNATAVAAGAVALYVAACEALPQEFLAFRFGDRLPYLIQYVLFGVIAALLVVPLVFRDPSREPGLYRSALAHPALSWLGKISYGIFLWQFPVLIGLMDIDATSAVPLPEFPSLLILTLAGTIICAAASYYLLERPLMRRFGSSHWAKPTPEPAVRAGAA
jgi:peptidoglycan/LPS O-acetylase OafA/YrhL